MIQSELILPFTAILITLTALTMLVILDWRICLIVLAIQYIGVFLVVSQTSPFAVAAAKLIAGWISAAVLGMAIINNKELQEQLGSGQKHTFSDSDEEQIIQTPGILGIAFRILTAGLISLTIVSQLPALINAFPQWTMLQTWSGLILIGFGLIKLSFTTEPFHILLALLTLLAGFEILYAALDKTMLSAGLFATVNLILALVGAYLLTAPQMEEEA